MSQESNTLVPQAGMGKVKASSPACAQLRAPQGHIALKAPQSPRTAPMARTRVEVCMSAQFARLSLRASTFAKKRFMRTPLGQSTQMYPRIRCMCRHGAKLRECAVGCNTAVAGVRTHKLYAMGLVDFGLEPIG